MDYMFIGLATACVLLAGHHRCLFLWLVLGEFAISAAWIFLPLSDPWWFLAYAGQNCAFVVAVMLSRHRLSREYAGTLIAAAVIATAAFCEYYMSGTSVYGVRPALMAWICTYQLLLAANGAKLVEGTPLEAARGIASRCVGRRRGAGADNPARSVGRGV